MLPPVLAVLFFVACQNPNSREDLRAYVNDTTNRITQSIHVGNVTARIQFQPERYRALFHADSTSSGDSGYIFFVARFTAPGAKGFAREKQLYLDFDIQQDFILQTELADSVMPSICQKIENGRSDNYEYMLAFEKPGGVTGNEGMTLFYKDRIFGIGTLAFHFSKADLEKVPHH